MTHQNISEGLVVGIHYTLKNDGGEVLDTSEEREPLEYLHGAHNIVPGLEKALTDMAIGDEFDVVIEPEDGYGTRQEDATETLDKDRLPEDMLVFPGMQLTAQDQDGQIYAMWVSEVGDKEITVDFNHPLAGERLHFAGRIISLRDASDEEKTHGHVHGPGHAHE